MVRGPRLVSCFDVSTDRVHGLGPESRYLPEALLSSPVAARARQFVNLFQIEGPQCIIFNLNFRQELGNMARNGNLDLYNFGLSSSVSYL